MEYPTSMASRKPNIVFVPGFWEAHGFLTVSAPHLSHAVTSACTSKTSLGLTVDDDIAAVRALVEPIAEAGQEVLIVLHSTLVPQHQRDSAIRRERRKVR